MTDDTPITTPSTDIAADATDAAQSPAEPPTPPDVRTSKHKPRVRSRKQYATADIANALERRYPQAQSAYAILYEVGNGSGMRCNRHCDALVMSLWPSRGIHLAGFEFKASRSDWLKEYADPAKADAIQRYCDYWWLAVADKDIVKEGELPENWGLMYLDSRGSLTTHKPAPKLSPVPMDRDMLAAIMRRAAEPVANVSQNEIRLARDAGRQEGRQSVEAELKKAKEKLFELQRKIHQFEHASGIDLGMREYSWRPGSPQKIGAAVRSILSGDLISGAKHIEHVMTTLRSASEQLANVLEVVKVGSQNIQSRLSEVVGDDEEADAD